MGKTPPPDRSLSETDRPKGWRSIDTAPQDGTRVLLRCLDWENAPMNADRSMLMKIVKIGQWTTSDKYWGCEDFHCWYDDSGYSLESDGWLPLPDVDEF
jgi:hypothetical protein